MEYLKEFNLDALINQRMEELCRNYSLKVENVDQKQTSSNTLRQIIDAKILAELGKRGNTETAQSEPSTSNYIGLKGALNLLPKSCDGRDIEQLRHLPRKLWICSIMRARYFQNSSTTSDNAKTYRESSSSIQESNILYVGSITRIVKDLNVQHSIYTANCIRLHKRRMSIYYPIQ